jgi:Raf kinase inhibitor-like YbhB/YbcL family protein
MRKAIVIGLAAIGLATAIGAGEGKMKIKTTAFQEGGNIPSKFTCDGADANPPLRFEGVPAEAKSLALIIDDSDAPGGLFTHWLVWNIDPKTTTVEENSAPSSGVQGKNDFGKSGYGGPCPPSGTHRYIFKVFALDRQLGLAAASKRAQLDAQMRGHILAQGELMGRYSRGR